MQIDMLRTAKFVTFTRHWVCENLGKNLDVQQAKVSSIQMHVAELSRLAVVQHKNGCRFSWFECTPSGRLLGLSLMAYGEGTLDKEELISLGLDLEIGDARSYFALPQEIPVRPLLALDEATFLSRFRFTQRQVEAIHGALALPADFERERRAPQDGLSTRIAECMQIPTRTVNESVVRQKLVFRVSSGEYSLQSSLGLRLTKNLSETSLCETSLITRDMLVASCMRNVLRSIRY